MDIQSVIDNKQQRQKTLRQRLNDKTVPKEGVTQAEVNDTLDELQKVSGDLRALNEAAEMVRQSR